MQRKWVLVAAGYRSRGGVAGSRATPPERAHLAREHLAHHASRAARIHNARHQHARPSTRLHDRLGKWLRRDEPAVGEARDHRTTAGRRAPRSGQAKRRREAGGRASPARQRSTRSRRRALGGQGSHRVGLRDHIPPMGIRAGGPQRPDRGSHRHQGHAGRRCPRHLVARTQSATVRDGREARRECGVRWSTYGRGDVRSRWRQTRARSHEGLGAAAVALRVLAGIYSEHGTQRTGETTPRGSLKRAIEGSRTYGGGAK